MRDDPQVISLVRRAGRGDTGAWHEIVERYAPLIWSVCGKFGLSRADTDDVGGNVWLALVEHLSNLRDPAALPGWIATTTQRECLRIVRSHQKDLRIEDAILNDPRSSADFIDEVVLAEERNIALRAAFSQLRPSCQQLLKLLLQDPPVKYKEISRQLDIAVGSIGATRSRCLDVLRGLLALADTTEPVDARAGRR